MRIQESTHRYERWMRQCTTVIEADLRLKHARMRSDPFLFLRGTFYRWAEVCPILCPDLHRAPRVLSVADLHVDNFGTWRDIEGRLAWGVDDFDEAYPLPYTNDLLRLATSFKVLSDYSGAAIKLHDACDAVLEGYRRTLHRGGHPIVLAERDESLETLGIEQLKPPIDFWAKLTCLPTVRREVPAAVRRALVAALPTPQPPEYRIVRRRAGVGSLGQRRLAAVAVWKGGCVAREAKALTPSACAWLAGEVRRSQPNYEPLLRSAIRAHDPFLHVVEGGAWLIRRLSPDSTPIEITALKTKRDEGVLLHAMGREAANVHLGSPRQREWILADLRQRKPSWLRDGAKTMARVVEREWKEYRAA